jgi:hypothetical protein
MNVAKSCVGVKPVCQAECHRDSCGKSAQQGGEGDPIHHSKTGRFAKVDPGRFGERHY